MCISLNYSPNFENTKRKLNQIKFIIFHYTGMKKELEAIKKLTDIKSKVSCHYLIKNNGNLLLIWCLLVFLLPVTLFSFQYNGK